MSKVAQGLLESLLFGELLDAAWSREVLLVAQDTGKPQDQIISEAMREIDALMGDRTPDLGDRGHPSFDEAGSERLV